MRPLLLFGAPGTGKTEALIQRMKALAAPPDKVLFLGHLVATKQEIARRTGHEARTIHSYARGLLPPTKILTAKNLKEFAAVTGTPMQFSAVFEDGRALAGDEYYRMMQFGEAVQWGWEKTFHFLYRPSLTPVSLSLAEFVEFCNLFSQWKSASNLSSFNDLLLMALRGGKRLESKIKAEYVFIDEVQDLTPLQWRFCERFFFDRHVVLAGDDDQAIFEWAGAFGYEMREFKGEIEVLKQGYRLPQNIFDYSQRIILRVKQRQAKDVRPAGADGEVKFYASPMDYDFSQLRSDRTYLFLGRTAEQVATWRKLLISHRLDFDISSSLEGHDLVELKRILSFEGKMSYFPRREWGIMKYWLKPEFKGLDRAGIDRLGVRKVIAIPPRYIEFFDYYTPKDEPCNIRVSTIHQAKGSEADEVFLLTGTSGRIVKETLEQYFMEAELRVFYVGSTRAKSALHIFRSESNNIDLS